MMTCVGIFTERAIARKNSGKLVHLAITSKLNIARTKFSNLTGYQMSCNFSARIGQYEIVIKGAGVT